MLTPILCAPWILIHSPEWGLLSRRADREPQIWQTGFLPDPAAHVLSTQRPQQKGYRHQKPPDVCFLPVMPYVQHPMKLVIISYDTICVYYLLCQRQACQLY
jgi:hypothetical protein